MHTICSIHITRWFGTFFTRRRSSFHARFCCDAGSASLTVGGGAGVHWNRRGLTQTLVVPLIGQLPAILNTTASNSSWVITITLLTGAVATPVVGRLGDMYGKRRMLLICTVPLVLGAIVCALSSSLLPMLLGRGMQGLGVGLIPLGISLLRDVIPAERLHSSIALMSASMGIGGALGLPVAAAVAENTSWRVLFWATAS